MVRINEVLNNRYELEELIGTGGMADVYRARDNLLGRFVAVKILHPHYAKDPVFIQRFRQEAQAAANLNQPNIVNVFDWGIEGETYYIVMEYVQGHDLKHIILEGGPLLPERAVEIAVAICAALEAAHENGIVHRDIKPQNIIVTNDNKIKVMDFGIARTAGGSAMTQTGTIMGTAQYISPEQAQGRPADPRSDLYSLGVVIFEMLTGKVPFEGENPVAIAYKHVREDPLPPSMINPDVSPELEAITMKALAKNPQNRYQNANEMRADLERCLEGAPVYATPVLPADEAAVGATQAYPAARPGGARRSRAWILIVVIIILLAGAGAGAYFLVASASGIKVPKVVGKSYNDAAKLLKAKNLGISISKRVIDPEKPKNIIISQDPSAGSKISKGGVVEVVVSKGPNLVTVPDCRGLTRQKAESAIKENGLTLGDVAEGYSSQIAKGLVASQEPEAGAKISQGSSVNLIISKGPEYVTVPSVVGQMRDDAVKVLENAGLQAEVSEVSVPGRPDNSVVEQSVSAGQRVAKGTVVTISVSVKAQEVDVPDVVGQSQSSAEDTLGAAGFVVSVTERTTSDPSEDGIVLEQDPSAGTKAEKGSTVTITVGKYSTSSSTSP